GAGARWKERLLYSFCARPECPNGPNAGLIMDRMGNLYGSTVTGVAPKGAGVVFQLAPSAASPTGFIEKVLHVFCRQRNCADGSVPEGALIRDRSGNLYGTTVVGGANSKGVVFELVSQPWPTSERIFVALAAAEHGAAIGQLARQPDAVPSPSLALSVNGRIRRSAGLFYS